MFGLRQRGLVLAAACVSAAALVVLLQAYGQRAAFHSDELNVLHHAGKFARGEVGRPGRPGLLWLLLAPLAWLESPEQILRLARWPSWLAVVGTTLAVLALAWPRGRGGAGSADRAAPWIPLLSVALLASAGLFMTHGIELRTDTFTTPLTLAVLLLLWRRSPRGVGSLLLAAALVAAAGLISQKSLYNAVGLALAWVVARPSPQRGMSWWRWRLRDAGLALAVVLALVAAWYLAIIVKSGGGSDVLASNMKTARNTAFGSDIPWTDKTGWLSEAVVRSPLLYLGAVFGLPLCFLRRARDGRPLASACVAGVMLGVIFIHRGFFPYYIASVEPFLVLPAAWGLATLPIAARELGQRFGIRSWAPPALAGLVVLWMLLACALGPARMPGFSPPSKSQPQDWGSVAGFLAAWDVTNLPQLRLAEDVEEVLGGTAPYIAGIGVAPGYREVTGYLTGMIRTKRRRSDRNFIATAMKRDQVPLFVRTYMSRDRYLTKRERRLLYTSYLPVRPNLYLHGARVRWREGETAGRRTVELFVDGHYRLLVRRGAGELDWVRVDGEELANKESRRLAAGTHEVEVGPAGSSGELWLLLGKDVQPQPPGKHVDLSVFPKDRGKSRSRYQLYDTKKQGYDLLSPPGTSRHKRQLKRHQRQLKRRTKKLRKAVTVKRDRPAEEPSGVPVPPGD